MDTSKLKSIRDRFSKLKHSVYTEDGTEIVLHPMLVIIFANGADKVIDKHDGSVYWDDATEILYHFFVNNHLEPVEPIMGYWDAYTRTVMSLFNPF